MPNFAETASRVCVGGLSSLAVGGVTTVIGGNFVDTGLAGISACLCGAMVASPDRGGNIVAGFVTGLSAGIEAVKYSVLPEAGLWPLVVGPFIGGAIGSIMPDRVGDHG